MIDQAPEGYFLLPDLTDEKKAYAYKTEQLPDDRPAPLRIVYWLMGWVYQPRFRLTDERAPEYDYDFSMLPPNHGDYPRECD